MEHRFFICDSLALIYSINASPATASMRLTPDAIPCSEIILKTRISEVLFTWVPPQSSMDTPGTSTTLTCNALYYKSKSCKHLSSSRDVRRAKEIARILWHEILSNGEKKIFQSLICFASLSLKCLFFLDRVKSHA